MKIGMVDQLPKVDSGLSAEDREILTNYLSEGPMDASILARALNPEFHAAHERRQTELRAIDWANLGQYRDANRAAAGRPQCVFLGDSITEAWEIADPAFFSDGILNRGISGQTSPQLVVRFMNDVVALRPAAVHILIGANDIVGNTGPNLLADFCNHLKAMVDMSKANDIAVILGTLPPFTAFLLAPEVAPAKWVEAINAFIGGLAADDGVMIADYYGAFAAIGGIKADGVITRDGLHPTTAGYEVMRPVALEALESLG